MKWSQAGSWKATLTVHEEFSESVPDQTVQRTITLKATALLTPDSKLGLLNWSGPTTVTASFKEHSVATDSTGGVTTTDQQGMITGAPGTSVLVAIW
jgi:hypothetical protein